MERNLILDVTAVEILTPEAGGQNRPGYRRLRLLLALASFCRSRFPAL